MIIQILYIDKEGIVKRNAEYNIAQQQHILQSIEYWLMTNPEGSISIINDISMDSCASALKKPVPIVPCVAVVA